MCRNFDSYQICERKQLLHFKKSTFTWEKVKEEEEVGGKVAAISPSSSSSSSTTTTSAAAAKETTTTTTGASLEVKRGSVIEVAAGGPQCRAWHSATRVHSVSVPLLSFLCEPLRGVSYHYQPQYTLTANRASFILEVETLVNVLMTSGSSTLEKGHKS